MFPDIIVWPDAHTLSNSSSSQQIYLFTKCTHFDFLPLLPIFIRLFIFNLEKIYSCLFIQTIFFPALPIYFLLFCPPIFLSLLPAYISCRAKLRVAARIYFLVRQGGYTSSNYPCPYLTPSPPPATTILILENGYLGDSCFSNKEIKLWVRQFCFDQKEKHPRLNSIRREILAAGNFHFKLGNCRGAKLRQYSEWFHFQIRNFTLTTSSAALQKTICSIEHCTEQLTLLCF